MNLKTKSKILAELTRCDINLELIETNLKLLNKKIKKIDSILRKNI